VSLGEMILFLFSDFSGWVGVAAIRCPYSTAAGGLVETPLGLVLCVAMILPAGSSVRCLT